MMFLSNKKYQALIRKIEKIEAIAERVNLATTRFNRAMDLNATLAKAEKQDEPKLVVHNNGKRKWHKRSWGELTATDAVMDIMKDGLPRHRNKICTEINQAGKCRIKVRPKTIGYAFTDLCAKGKLQRVGDGVYARAS